MYRIIKTIDVSASHHLDLSYESKCLQDHGHNWRITIFCKSENLNKDGMVIDFSQIKATISNILDHKNLNEVLKFNPTAENIAKWVVDTIPHCYKATVKESEGSIAIYEKNQSK